MTQSLSTETNQDASETMQPRDEQRETVFDQIPAPLNALIGRDRELDLVRGLLARENVRLVTLTGPGGVGKTRLALALAAEAGADVGADDPRVTRVAFVPLAPLHDAALIPATIGDRLNVHESGERALTADLIDRLQNERVLLVLDNFEHLLTGAPVVAELLAACPGVTALITSRRRLGLSGEHEVPIPPLALADPGRTATIEELGNVPAIRLFVARAQAAAAGFTFTAANALAVAEICQRLDGLPLAIELAAPRTRLLSPTALLARLTHRLELLAGGPSDVPERLQTMRQTIAWSYDLLDPAEQTLFRRLAVFAGGIPFAAVEAFAIPSWPAYDLGTQHDPSAATGNPDPLRAELPTVTTNTFLAKLTTLVDESLVQITEQPDGERRFGMLETVREYALERLEDSGEAAGARRRHVEFYLRMVESVDPWQYVPQDALERFQTEHDNVRAALDWSIVHASETALRIAAGFWQFWQQKGYWSEGRGWLERALATESDAPPSVRAAVLAGAGSMADRQNDFVQARAFFEESLALARQGGDERRAARSLRSLGIVASNQNELDDAAALFEEALVELRAIQDQAAIASCLNDLGLVADRRGDRNRAIAYYEEALPLARATGDQTHAALILSNLGGTVTASGDMPRGEALTAEALDQSRAVGDLYGVASNLYNLADCFRQRDEIAGAWERYRESLTISAELGEKHLVSLILDQMAHLLTLTGLPRPAAHLLGAAAALRQRIGDTLFPIEEATFAEFIVITRAAETRLDDA
ncbi:MAG: tetratricopeptide repeat protein [Chloroflexota bacterium]|nr:tetratricopeptide repeat protein [Chloroflexota bacterium]